MIVFAGWLVGMAGHPTGIFTWPGGSQVAVLVLAGAWLASVAVLVALREQRKNGRAPTPKRTDGVGRGSDACLPHAA